MTTNKELIIKDFEDKILPTMGNLDRAICLPTEADVDHMFFDPMTDKVVEVSFKDGGFYSHDYTFNGHMSFCIIKTKNDNRFICVDWAVNELTILTYKMDQYGLKNYIVKNLPYKPLHEHHDLYNIYELIIPDLADCSTFELYFQSLFHDHDDENVNKMLIKNKLLD